MGRTISIETIAIMILQADYLSIGASREHEIDMRFRRFTLGLNYYEREEVNRVVSFRSSGSATRAR